MIKSHSILIIFWYIFKINLIQKGIIGCKNKNEKITEARQFFIDCDFIVAFIDSKQVQKIRETTWVLFLTTL